MLRQRAVGELRLGTFAHVPTTPPGLPDPADHSAAWWDGQPAIYAWWSWVHAEEHRFSRVVDEYRVLARYSEAVATADAVRRLAALGPIVEVGAGGGYWARLIRDVGGDVIATDADGDWYGDVVPWIEVQRLEAVTAVQQHPERVVLSCWPPRPYGYMTHVLEAALQSTVALVTDGRNGRVDQDPLYARLDSSWTLAETIDLPRWPGRFDSLMLWVRG